jgi:hypothetical protein
MERLNGVIEEIKVSRDRVVNRFVDSLLNDLGWKNRVISPNNRLVHGDFSYLTRSTRLKIHIDPSILERLSSRQG